MSFRCFKQLDGLCAGTSTTSSASSTRRRTEVQINDQHFTLQVIDVLVLSVYNKVTSDRIRLLGLILIKCRCVLLPQKCSGWTLVLSHYLSKSPISPYCRCDLNFFWALQIFLGCYLFYKKFCSVFSFTTLDILEKSHLSHDRCVGVVLLFSLQVILDCHTWVYKKFRSVLVQIFIISYP